LGRHQTIAGEVHHMHSTFSSERVFNVPKPTVIRGAQFSRWSYIESLWFYSFVNHVLLFNLFHGKEWNNNLWSMCDDGHSKVSTFIFQNIFLLLGESQICTAKLQILSPIFRSRRIKMKSKYSTPNYFHMWSTFLVFGNLEPATATKNNYGCDRSTGGAYSSLAPDPISDKSRGPSLAHSLTCISYRTCKKSIAVHYLCHFTE
jgi:hypothetical protein